MNTALEYSTRVVQEGGRRCKKSTLNDLVHLTPLRIPLMNPPEDCIVYSVHFLPVVVSPSLLTQRKHEHEYCNKINTSQTKLYS
jgi:hypothetical protein